MKTFYLSPLLLAIAATTSFASTITTAAKEELIVTGSYSPVSNEQLSSSVSVINKEQLRQLSNHSLLDAMRQIPSLWIDDQGGPGGITSINLRGAEANHTLVLLDGVQLNDPTNTRGGAFDINSINVESIERIEIIRGAQSAIYGSDALAGVIHIITQAPSDEQSIELNANAGTKGYSSAGLSSSGKLGQLGYALGLQTKDGGNALSGSSAKNTEFTSRFNWQEADQGIGFSYRYLDGERTSFPEQSGGPEYAIDRDLDRSDFRDQNAALNWQWQINKFWQTKTQAAWYQRDDIYSSPGIAPYDAVPPNGSTTDFNRTTLSWVNTLGNKSTYWSNLGLETRREAGESQGYLDFGFKLPTDFSLARRINSVFVNFNGYIAPALLLQASLRRDDTQDLGANNSSQMGARYAINEQLSWFANWGEGFKLPSFFALGHPLVGNEDLKPETVTTRDTGIAFTSNTLSGSLSYFKQEFKDLIDFDSETFKNVNRSRVNTSGAESEISWQLNSQVTWRVQASYTDIDMLSSDNHLLGRPQFTWGSSLHYAPNEDWQFNLHYLQVADRFAVSRYSGNDQEQTLAAYNRLDANIDWQVNKQLTLGVSLDNLTASNYETDIGFPAPDTSALITLRFKL